MKKQKGSKGPVIVAVIAICVLAVVAVVALKSPEKETIEVAAPAKSDSAQPSQPKAASDESFEMIIKRDPEENPVAEMKYLPDRIEIADSSDNPMRKTANFREGNRRLMEVRALTDPEKDGEFISPRISPDGMQVMLTRPGWNGVYVMDLPDGEPVLIAQENSFHARWTADGRIEITSDDKTKRIYGTDGTLEETLPYDPDAELFFSENDTIMVRSEEGAAPVAITGSDDKYFAPNVSPDGEYIAYQGLYSGVYIVRADGKGEPVYLGEGNNAVWGKDSSEIFFDYTQDDGHDLTAGDLFYIDLNSSEKSNLTDMDERIAQSATVGPDGSVAYEAEGQIFIGTMN